MKLLRVGIISALVFLFSSFNFPGDNDFPAYLIYDSNGKKVKFSKMLKSLYDADVIFVGELHNNPISHWMELQLTKALFENGEKDLVLGAEMFEADNQLILDEYLNGTIKESNFKSEMRLWPNYQTDYKPMVEFAREKGVPFIATNVPRRYASVVFKKGFNGLDSLSDEAKRYLPPLPISYDPNVKCYKDMLEQMGGHGGENLPKAQALKDATMAHFITENWKKKACFLHFNGAYHSDNHQGIVLYVKDKQEDLKIVTITTVLQDNVTELAEENKGRADFILVVDADMTSTH